MKCSSLLVSIIAAVATMTPRPGYTQDDEAVLCISIDCMKSTAIDYVSVETDVWHAMHQELLDLREQVSSQTWRLIAVTKPASDEGVE